MNGEVLRIDMSESTGALVLRLSGELDSYTSSRLADMPDAWLWGYRKVIVNMDRLEYIDSSGLSVLVSMWVKAMEKGVRLVISCRSPRIYRVLEITGLLNLFQMDSAGPEARGLLAAMYGNAAADRVDSVGVLAKTPSRRSGAERR